MYRLTVVMDALLLSLDQLMRWKEKVLFAFQKRSALFLMPWYMSKSLIRHKASAVCHSSALDAFQVMFM